MDGFRQASCVARHLSDIYSPIFSPATSLFLCDSLWRHEKSADSLVLQPLLFSVPCIEYAPCCMPLRKEQVRLLGP